MLKGSQRGNAAQRAWHLLNLRETEHVELYELRGFSSDGLLDALSRCAFTHLLKVDKPAPRSSAT